MRLRTKACPLKVSGRVSYAERWRSPDGTQHANGLNADGVPLPLQRNVDQRDNGIHCAHDRATGYC